MDETLTPGEDSTAAAPKASSGRPRASRSRHNSWIPRPAYVAITFVLLLTIGWGAFRIIDRPSQLDEETELANLQNFNDEPPSLGAPDRQVKPRSGNSTLREFSSHGFGERVNPWQTSLTPSSNERPTPFVPPVNATSRLERSPLATNLNPQATSGAWLIGTIEADNVPERIALPPRVSQTIAEGPRFR